MTLVQIAPRIGAVDLRPATRFDKSGRMMELVRRHAHPRQPTEPAASPPLPDADLSPLVVLGGLLDHFESLSWARP